jgi:PDZ domain-containing protein
VTLLIGIAVLAVLVVGSFVGIKVPYVELGPGPTWNTLGSDRGKELISISGGPTSESKGQLRMVTVGVEDDISLFQAIQGWLNPSDAVVPREVIYPPDQTQQQVDQQNQQDFKQSQNSAETAALRYLGYKSHIVVDAVVAGQPAEGHLQVSDVIDSVDGTAVGSSQDLVNQIRSKSAGSTVTIGYTRHGTAGTTSITTAKAPDGTTRIGVQADDQVASPYTITFSLDDVGGPSAGLMFSLGIVDKLTPNDLTAGLTIAGTGTIDDQGNVGAIGGIAQKMRGAKRDGATIFLSPADNCAEAVANAVPGLELVKVSTLSGAVGALKTLADHGTPPMCSAH